MTHLAATAIYFNTEAVETYGGRLSPVRERGLVEQVVAVTFQTFGG